MCRILWNFQSAFCAFCTIFARAVIFVKNARTAFCKNGSGGIEKNLPGTCVLGAARAAGCPASGSK